MDRNLLLAFALSFLVLSTWSMWQQKQRPQTPPPVEQPAVPEAGGASAAAQHAAERFPDLPAAAEAPAERPREAADPALVGRAIRVESALYRAELNTLGGVISHWELREYEDRYGDPIVLIDSRFDGGGVGATPLLELGRGDFAAALWEVEGESAREVIFRVEREGVRVRKLYRFEPGSYAFRLAIEIENQARESIAPRCLVDWPARQRPGNDFREQALAVLHEGSLQLQPIGGLGSPGFFGSLFGKKPVGAYDPYVGEVDWAGVDTPYFFAALLPDAPAQASARFVVLERGKAGAVEIFFDPVQVPSGQRVAREFRGYAGPKEPERLEAMGGGAIASINLGWSWVAPLTRLFGWLLAALYSIIPNYGIAIILLTVLVRVVTAPLTVKQMRSMERMRRLQPKIKEIQQRHSDDRQKQSEEMMRMYRQEKVNPLGGCLPMLLQFPVFIGLYFALRSSIQLRHAPFVGWIDDLSAPDELFVLPGIGIPVRVLPLVMGATMVLQQKITPMQADPAQARLMMTVMPVMMTLIFYQFPSGLVLYWLLSSVLAIAHQLWIGRKMEPVAATRASGKERQSEPA